MSWSTHFRFPLAAEAWLYISAYITGQHSKHAPLTISVRSIKDRYFPQKSECNWRRIIGLVLCRETVTTECYQETIRNFTSLLELYEYDCRVQSDGSAARTTRLPASIRCLCGTCKTVGFNQMSLRHTHNKNPGFNQMVLRHIHQEYRFQSDVSAAHTRLSVSIRWLCGTYIKNTGFNQMSLRHTQQESRFQSDGSTAHTSRTPVSIRCPCGTHKTAGFNQMWLQPMQQDSWFKSDDSVAYAARLSVSTTCRYSTYSKTTGFNQMPLRHLQ